MRRPNNAASWAVALTRGCQPARPWETKSSVAMAFETWNGSVCVTVATGTNPMCRVTGAMRAATRTASARLRHQGVIDGEEVEQSPLPMAASCDQYRPLMTGSAPSVTRHACGCPP